MKKRNSNTPGSANERERQSERLDVWLWAARFFKTRSLAADFIDRGKVDVNGARAKRATQVVVGAEISVRRGPYESTVVVLALASNRGPASEAALLYEETETSKARRATTRAQLASLPVRPLGEGRPTKKDRRALRELRGRDS